MLWLVIIDDPDLHSAYHGVVEAEGRHMAISKLAVAAVDHTATVTPMDWDQREKSLALRAAKAYGSAVPVDGYANPSVDLGCPG